jgi:hypothetical protein
MERERERGREGGRQYDDEKQRYVLMNWLWMNGYIRLMAVSE